MNVRDLFFLDAGMTPLGRWECGLLTMLEADSLGYSLRTLFLDVERESGHLFFNLELSGMS